MCVRRPELRHRQGTSPPVQGPPRQSPIRPCLIRYSYYLGGSNAQFEHAFAQQAGQDSIAATVPASAHWFKRTITPGRSIPSTTRGRWSKSTITIDSKWGGIAGLSLLVATPVEPAGKANPEEEDSSVLLLRMMDAAPLPSDFEAQRVRVESAQCVSGDSDTHWDRSGAMDAATHYLLSFAGMGIPTNRGGYPLRLASDHANPRPVVAERGVC